MAARIRLGDRELGPGDGAANRDEERLALEGVEEAEVLLWELPDDRAA